jgi:hypothetical protein
MQNLISFCKKHYLLLIIAGFIVLRIPSLFEGFWYQDEGFYAAIGKAIFSGKVLYQDIWDHKPPLMFWLFGLIFSTLPANIGIIVVKTLSILSGILSLNLIAKIADQHKVVQTNKILVLVIVGLLLGLPLLEGNIANSEIFFINITLAIILLLNRKSNHYLIGFLVFVGLLIKPQALIESLSIISIFLLFARTLLNNKAVFKIIAGLLIPSLIFGAYLLYSQTFTLFIDSTLFENIKYSSSYTATDNIINILFPTLYAKAAFGLIILASSLVFEKRSHISKRLAIAINIFILELLISILSGREYPHYFLQTLPGMAILTLIILSSKRTSLVFKNLLPIIIIFFYVTLSSLGASPINHLIPIRYYTAFIENYFLNKTNNAVPIWANGEQTTRSQHLADYLNNMNSSTSSKVLSYYLYTEQPWTYTVINLKSTNKYIVWYHYDYSEEIYKSEIARATSSDLIVIDNKSKVIESRFLDDINKAAYIKAVSLDEGFDIYTRTTKEAP